MTDADYSQLLADKFREFGRLLGERDRINVEIAKLKQFLFATINMLPDQERSAFREELAKLSEQSDAHSAGLTDSIRRVLNNAYPKYLSVSEVRDRLHDFGFDFTGYTSNPLATVGTILRRMVPKEADVTESEGISVYRRKQIARRTAKSKKGID